MNKINFENKRLGEKSISIFEISILIISILAFAYFIGGEFKVVGASTEAPAATAPVAGDQSVTFGGITINNGGPLAPPVTPVPTVNPAGSVVPYSPAGPTPEVAPLLDTPTPPASGFPSSIQEFASRMWDSGNLLINAAVAATLYLGIRALFEWSGWCPNCDPELVQAWATALGVGYGAGAGTGMLLAALAGDSAWGLPIFGLTGAGWGLIGLGVALLYMIFIYREHYQVQVQYTCYPWKPNTGGSDCDLCNNRDFPCTQYKCQSLGQSCELLNPGETTQVCAWKDRNDAAPPTISAWNEVLTEGYTYIPLTTETGDKGVEIKNTNSADGCVPAFGRLDYGIQLDKAGQCRIDLVRKKTFDEMINPGLINRGNWLKEFALFSLHGGIDAANESGVSLPNGGKYQIFVRCLSRNNVPNTGTFVLQYCVTMQPDLTAPAIKLTDLPNGAPIQFGQTSRKTDVYIDKPSECRWDHNDVDYEVMAEKMSCSPNIGANTYFKCTANLTGLKDGVENKFYFNCKSYPSKQGTDKQSERRTMATNYPYRLIGTKPLVIDSISPESGAVIKDATVSVKVTLKAVTSAGYNDGAAKCWYKKKADADNKYNLFANPGTFSYQSSQDLWFTRGSYAYTIRCCDLGGNCATQETSFSVDTDFLAPIITRAYNEGSNLKIITDESAECVYDTTSCSYKFDDGIKMSSSDNLAHTTEWNTKSNFYIKCKDEFGNQPAPDSCSIIVRPFNTY